ncbi:PKD domain-containing protein [bacterium]|nr:PKD domain-containing protein [bacterium]
MGFYRRDASVLLSIAPAKPKHNGCLGSAWRRVTSLSNRIHLIFVIMCTNFCRRIGTWTGLAMGMASPTFSCGQATVSRVLFIGNSYTYVNDLPGMLTQLMTSAGDSLMTAQSVPGGYTFALHRNHATTLSLIQQGDWDYVVLQEQSQRPSFPLAQVQQDVYPYAFQLDSIVQFYNPCAETVFYQTWGRKNGDAGNCASWPPVCTYAGMDSLLALRYRTMADSFSAVLSPVGAVWKHLRTHYPAMELYASDGSHPSLAGTYAAACSFYTVLTRNSPLGLVNVPGLDSVDAWRIRSAVQNVVTDSLIDWNVGAFDPVADFDLQVVPPLQIALTDLSLRSDSVFWDFGDGQYSSDPNPVHTYAQPGNYAIQLRAIRCQQSDSTVQNAVIGGIGIGEVTDHNGLFCAPNPTRGWVRCSDPSGQWKPVCIIAPSGMQWAVENEAEPWEGSFFGRAPGVYVLHFQSMVGSGHRYERIVVY